MKKFLCLFIFLALPSFCFADKVVLKSGQEIRGKIVERTPKYIKIDFMGTILTYWQDGIESIKNDNGNGSAGPVEKTQSQLEESAESYFKKGTDYLKAGKWQEAKSELEKAIVQSPNNVGAQFNLGCAYALLGEYNQAIEIFKRTTSMEAAPYTAFCYFNLAAIYIKKACSNFKTKTFKEAEANFMEAAGNFDKAAGILPYFNLAIDYSNTCKGFQGLGRLETNPLQHQSKLSFDVQETGVPPDSALFLDEKNMIKAGVYHDYDFNAGTVPMLYFWKTLPTEALVGISYAQQEKYAEARGFLENVLQRFPTEELTKTDKLAKWSILILLSQVYLRLGWDKDMLLAKENGLLEEVKRLNFGFPRDNALAAFVCVLQGDYSKAAELANKVLSADPYDGIAKDVLQAIKQLQNTY